MSTEQPSTPPRRVRTQEQLRGVVSMLAHFIWYRRTRPGDHMWSIPADPERDWDCILTDAIDELVALRAQLAEREQEIAMLKRAIDGYDGQLERIKCTLGLMAGGVGRSLSEELEFQFKELREEIARLRGERDMWRRWTFEAQEAATSIGKRAESAEAALAAVTAERDRLLAQGSAIIASLTSTTPTERT